MSGPSIAIRLLEAGDVDAIAEMLRELASEFVVHEFVPSARQHFLEANNAEAIRGFIANGFRYHVAEIDGALAGFVAVRDDSHLYHLFVAKALQRRGIGRHLWDEARRECERRGHAGPFSVNSSNNAVPVYEAWGFVRDGPAKNDKGVLYNPMRLG